MKGIRKEIAVLIGLFAVYGYAGAQGVITGQPGSPPDWGFECTDPKNTNPVSNPYISNFVANELMLCAMGGGGTWAAGGGHKGGANDYVSPCFSPNVGQQTTNNAGKFCFSYGYWLPNTLKHGNNAAVPGGVGSIQQYSEAFNDRAMAINFGAPEFPTNCFANFLIDNQQVYFGDAFTLFAFGQSNRYMTFVETLKNNINVHLQVELVADAVRFRWMVTNNDTKAHSVGLWFGSGIQMLDDQSFANEWQEFDGTPWPPAPGFFPNYSQKAQRITGQGTSFLGPDQSGSISGYNGIQNDFSGVFTPTGPDRLSREDIGATPGVTANFQGPFVYASGQRPPDTDQDYDITKDPINFPAFVDFDWGETDPFGIRIETKPSPGTNDTNPTNVPTKATEFLLGKESFINAGDPVTSNKPLFIGNPGLVPDTPFLTDPAFIIKFPPVSIQPAGNFQFLNYVRSTWGNGDYKLPFGAVVDAPKVVQAGPNNFDGTPSNGGLIRNPMDIRVWIDNVGGDVSHGYGVDNKEFPLDDVNIALSFGAPGMTIQGGSTQVIPQVLPRTSGFVDFHVTVGPNVVGEIPYTVTISTIPVNRKVISGTIVVSGRPRIVLNPGANLITAPYVFADSSWLAILANFVDPVVSGATVQTYSWDATRQAYEINLAAQRGNAVWAIYNNPAKQPVWQNFGGQPSTPFGFQGTTQLVELKPGWNMIANPFDLEFPITQINGVAAANPDQVFTYSEMVSLGYISSFVATWDPVHQNYQYIDAASGVLQPNTGYWVNDLLSNSDITISYPPLFTEASAQSSNVQLKPSPLWKMNLSATQGANTDLNVTLGAMGTAADARKQTIMKAPMSPTQKLRLSVLGSINAKPAMLHQTFSTPNASYSWPVAVDALQTGAVQLSWPSLASVPKTLNVFLVDQANGETIDMRQQSVYGYTQISGGRHQFNVIAVPATTTAIISSLSANETNSIFNGPSATINYGLASAATTSLQVLASDGSLVATVHGPRVDKAGANQDTWNLRNSAGQRVLPGYYTVKLKALTTTGGEDSRSVTVSIY